MCRGARDVGFGPLVESRSDYGRRNADRRLGAVVRRDRQLRSDRRVPRRRVGRPHTRHQDAGRLHAHRGSRGEQDRPRSGDDRPQADRPRADVHVPPEAEHQVRPAGQPRDHVEGLRDRVRAARQPERRRRVRLLLHGDQGLERLRRGVRDQGRVRIEVDLGHPDAQRDDDRLPSDPADGRRCSRPARCRPR
jgi:hypothetical protein